MLVFMMAMDTPEERSTFEKIYYAYRGKLYKLAMEYLQDDRDAEDAVHQTFLYAAENMQKFSGGVCNKTLSYLVKVVRSRSLDILRKRKHIISIALYENVSRYPKGKLDLSPLADCMRKLPERDQDVLILRFVYGFEYKEIGKMMKISETNARTLVSRAKDKLEALCVKEGIL